MAAYLPAFIAINAGKYVIAGYITDEKSKDENVDLPGRYILHSFLFA
ncbi:MAG: hypothetical protein GXP08_01225 [Gammaproteobacteria bacterium]|nr:hypothetical protein [Gammaproteobacteria bacterium]